MRRYLAALLLWFALATAAHAEWHLAETAHFRLYLEGKADAARAKAEVLEDFRRLLVTWTGREPPSDTPKLDVYLVRRIANASPGQAVGANVAGFWRATPGGMAAFAEQGNASELGGQVILFHEVAHHFMLSDALLAYPAWYIEGFAEYFSTAEFKADRIELGKFSENRAQWLLNGVWISPERLLRGTSGMRGGDSVAMFYAQSWLLTHWLFRAPEAKGKLLPYLRRTSAGEDPVEAFKAEVMLRPVDLNPKLRTYLESPKNTYSRVKREPLTPAEVTVTSLPPSADRLLMPMVAIEHGVGRERGAALLALVRTEAAKAAPDDWLAKRALAVAELNHGDAATAARLIDDLLAAAPDDPTLLRWRGQAWLRAPADVSAARRSFVRAFKVDPDDWRTLMAWVRTFDPTRLSDAQLEVLRRAWTLAPQVSQNVLAMAVALGHRGELAEAARVLKPLAYSPHGGRLGELAETLMTHAEAGNREAFLAAVPGSRAASPELSPDPAAPGGDGPAAPAPASAVPACRGCAAR
jgi:hypothetical protein